MVNDNSFSWTHIKLHLIVSKSKVQTELSRPEIHSLNLRVFTVVCTARIASALDFRVTDLIWANSGRLTDNLKQSKENQFFSQKKKPLFTLQHRLKQN